jgi:hypothetical protein
MSNAHQILTRKLERMGHLEVVGLEGRLISRDMGCKEVEFIYVAQNSDQKAGGRGAVMNRVTKFRGT